MKIDAFLCNVREKKVPSLRSRASWGDLYLQEEAIAKELAAVKTLDDAEAIIDKLLMYMALNKSRQEGGV